MARQADTGANDLPPPPKHLVKHIPQLQPLSLSPPQQDGMSALTHHPRRPRSSSGNGARDLGAPAVLEWSVVKLPCPANPADFQAKARRDGSVIAPLRQTSINHLAELEEIVSQACDTEDSIDDALRAYLSLTTQYKGASMDPQSSFPPPPNLRPFWWLDARPLHKASR